jgi:hypothetical protein
MVSLTANDGVWALGKKPDEADEADSPTRENPERVHPTDAAPSEPQDKKSAEDKLRDFCEKVTNLDVEGIELELKKMFGAAQNVAKEEEMTKKARLAEQGFMKDSAVLEVAQLVETGQLFDPQGRIGKLFQKVHENGSPAHGVYNQDRQIAAKNKYKMEWQERFLDEFLIGKSHEKCFQRVDSTRGDMLDFGSLVQSYGILYDRARAVGLATKHATKCNMMAGNV